MKVKYARIKHLNWLNDFTSNPPIDETYGGMSLAISVLKNYIQNNDIPYRCAEGISWPPMDSAGVQTKGKMFCTYDPVTNQITQFDEYLITEWSQPKQSGLLAKFKSWLKL